MCLPINQSRRYHHETGCWRPSEGHDFTVCLEFGWSEFESELNLDARRWIKHPGSSIALCLTVNLEQNPDKITLSVYEPLRSGTNGHTSASVTHTVTRATPHSLIEFQSHGDPPQALADIRLPEVAFTGYNQGDLDDNLILTEEDFVRIGTHRCPTHNGYSE